MPTVNGTALRDDLERLYQQTANLLREARPLVAETTPTQWIWSPDRNTWSLCLILDHLNTVARLVLPRVEEALTRLRSEGCYSDLPPRYNGFERFFIRLLSPDPPFKVPVPPIYIPKPPNDPLAQAGSPFLGTLERMMCCIESADGLDLKRIKIASPASSLLRLTTGAWLEGLTAHNAYHWMQVEALRRHPGFPAG